MIPLGDISAFRSVFSSQGIPESVGAQYICVIIEEILRIKSRKASFMILKESCFKYRLFRIMRIMSRDPRLDAEEHLVGLEGIITIRFCD